MTQNHLTVFGSLTKIHDYKEPFPQKSIVACESLKQSSRETNDNISYFFRRMIIMKLEVIPFTGSQDAVAVISFPHGGITDYWAFKSACEGCPYTDKKLDGGAVCAALTSLIKSRLLHPASEAAASGLTGMNFSVDDSHVIISANCKKSAAGIRKVCNTICKNLRPDKCYGFYSILIGRLYGNNSKGIRTKIRPDRSCFDHCAGKLIKGIDNLSIGLFGRVDKLTKDALDGIKKGADNKLSEMPSLSGTMRTAYDLDIETCCTFETLGFGDQLSAVIAQDYLMSIMPVFDNVHDGKISVEESVLKALKMADKESKFKAFSAKFLKSRTDEGLERMIYYAASRAAFTVEDAVTASKKQLSQSAIESIIKKAL